MDKNYLIAGVDEVGRGPLAGPVVAAAVILDPQSPIEGLADSKKLSAKRREELFPIIQQNCLAWAVGRAEVDEIDQINILNASLLAMQRAIMKLNLVPVQVLVDGIHPPKVSYPVRCIVQGDQTEAVISAASILAKVTRDREMIVYDAYYPQYGYAKHKGYGTKQHFAAIAEHGITNIHRRSFAPIKDKLL